MNYCHVVIAGHLVRDPSLKYMESGLAVCNFTMAYSTYRNREEHSNFVDVAAFDKQARIADEYLAKGSPALVEGELVQNRWTNKDGQNRSKLEIRARRIVPLSRGDDHGEMSLFDDA